MSPQLQDLVPRLLERDEGSRLGSVSGGGGGCEAGAGGTRGLGAEEVKVNPWFDGID